MKVFTRYVSLIVVLLMIISTVGVASASAVSAGKPLDDLQDSAARNYITNFAQALSHDPVYSAWSSASPAWGYALYGSDFNTVVGHLYYMVVNGQNVGYVIINSAGNSVFEFSVGLPAFDRITSQIARGNIKRIYVYCMPAILSGNTYMDISMSGEILQSIDVENGIMPAYNPQIQGGNCIVGAISNLMWHWSNNGYSSLASGMTFQEVESEVDDLINDEGGYANANIPNTIKNYVKSKNTSYSAKVTNQWNPSFNNVKTEVTSRPCLLGFAAGSPFSKDVGHMTVCTGTRTVGSTNYVKLMDGWTDSITEKQWGSYNDFMSKVVMSK